MHNASPLSSGSPTFAKKVPKKSPNQAPDPENDKKKSQKVACFIGGSESHLHHYAAKLKFRAKWREKVCVLREKKLADFTTPQRNAALDPFFDKKTDSAAKWRSRSAF